MVYEKIDDRSFKEIKQAETIYNLSELEDRKLGLQNDIIRIQEEIAGIDALLFEAGKLGVIK